MSAASWDFPRAQVLLGFGFPASGCVIFGFYLGLGLWLSEVKYRRYEGLCVCNGCRRG